MNDLKALQDAAKTIRILYAEDNAPLRLNATKLLKKFFEHLLVASDGKEALEIFKKTPTDIVLSDIKMPHMDGFELIEQVKVLAPKTKCIIMSAFDEKEFLRRSIDLGVDGYLKKPVNISELTQTLAKIVKDIKKEQESELFFMHLKTIFNYQSSMVAMLQKDKVVLANQFFLDFFDVKSSEEYNIKYLSVGSPFLPHDGFLYNYANIDWFEIVEQNEKKLFHIKMKDREKKVRHFILKYQKIPQKNAYGILSFDDITELNLLGLFDAKQAKDDAEIERSESLVKLLGVLQRNSAQLEVHNYYKGLSITNKGVIERLTKDSLSLKSTYLQLKGIQYEQKTLLVSEALPYHLECASVVSIGFERQSALLKGLRFVETSAVQRKTIRVTPEEKHSATLFLNEKKFYADILIEDISLDAVRLSMSALPAGLQKDDLVRLDIVLELDKRPLILNTQARVYSKFEHKHSFSVVFMFEQSKKSELLKYITKRQMAIIREFKGLQNG